MSNIIKKSHICALLFAASIAQASTPERLPQPTEALGAIEEAAIPENATYLDRAYHSLGRLFGSFSSDPDIPYDEFAATYDEYGLLQKPWANSYPGPLELVFDNCTDLIEDSIEAAAYFWYMAAVTGAFINDLLNGEGY
jgi:hypothetical protein